MDGSVAQLLAVEVPRLPVAVVGGEVETAAWSMSNSLRHCYDPRWSVNFGDVDTGFHVHHLALCFLSDGSSLLSSFLRLSCRTPISTSPVSVVVCGGVSVVDDDEEDPFCLL